ncbi:MAG: hypothetical protein ONB46_02565 [candidate division KSB1 bacterium]|nr:hypothetical protein [candidate division KSB1 bacterium]MDZ7364882.1 hypothetical protein [candidate division KSB1 bacterium]MDZ7402985.1 hypothetical protein [candidate division KSB1 bacterium]
MLRLIWPLLLSLLFVAPSFGQTLTQVKITPSDTVAGNGTVYTVSFITSAGGTGLPNNGKIRLTFPAAFGVSTVALAGPVSPPNGITGGFTEPVVAGQIVTLARDGTGANVAPADTAVFKMAVVINPVAAAKYSLLVETLTSANTLIDSAPSDSFRIGVGPLAYVKVLNLASGNTSEVAANTLTADQTLSMHAGGFDARGNYRGDVSVNWSVTGGIGTLSAASGVATVFSANKVGNGQIIADHPTPGVLDGATGNITVVPGALAKVFVVAGTFDDGPQFGAHTMTTDQTLTVHAAGYDSDNNYIQDESVTWTVTGGIGVLSPTTGTTTTLDARTPGIGKINADHATLTDDPTDFITVNLGAPYRVKILSGLSGPTAEVNTASLNAGQTLTVHASSFDADDNYIGDVSVNWSVTGGIGSLSAATGVSTTLTAQTVGTGVINADHAMLIDDATGNITVSAGALAKVKVVQGTSGNGPQMGAVTVTTDNTLTVHAAGYDAHDNYVGDQVVTWSVSGGIGTVFPTIATSTTLTLTTPGTGVITADHNTVADGFSGTITVNAGSPYRVKILTGASGNTGEVTAQTLTTGATLAVHAGSFDADGNYTGDVPVTWTVSGNIGTLSPGTGISTTLSATTPGSGVITADHASLIDGVSATITVAAGALSFVKVVEGPAGNGPELLAKTLTTDQNLTVHAAGYDAAGNYLGDFSVTWSLSNGATGSLSPTTGAATTFNPTRTGTTTITANHATATDDVTGTITINTGAQHHVKVLSGASGNTAEVTTQTLTAGSTFQVHASSFDADDNRIADVSVNWVLSGGIGSLSPSSGVSTTLTASTAGTGIITADHSTLFDDATGIITVNAGALSFVKIVEGASGNGPEMGGKSLTTDNTLTVHAAGYDAHGNYISDVSVNWSVTGGIGTVSPATGTSTTLTLTTPGSGIITAAHATATPDDSGPISVSTGVAHHVKVLSGATGNTAEVTTASLPVGNTLAVHAGSFDADDNYIADVSVTWSVTGGIGSLSSTVNTTTTLTAEKVGSGAIFADHPTLIDDATGAITVSAGPLAKVRIVEGESGNGPELLDKTVTTDQSITVHAAGYDAADNYLGDFSVNWTVSGGIGTFSTATGASTRLNLTTVGSGVINADHATVADDQSGTITVNAGNPHHVKILSGSNGNTSEVGAQNLTTGANLLVHAGSFDADDNYTGDVSVSWLVSGGIGNVAPSAGTTTTFTATTAGTGTIIADHSTLIDDATGLITVTTGALSYIKIVEGSSGNGPELGAVPLTTDQILTVHAAGYDAGNNYLGDFSVNWSVTGGIGVLSTNLGVTTTFDPRTPGTGTISADHPTAGVGDDVTGTITVTLGAPNRIKVLSGTSGNTTEVQTANLTAGETLDVHAGSFDADGNFTGDVSVAWSVSGGIGTLTPPSGITTRLTATTAGTGVITGDHATLIDDATGTITVTPGPLSYIKIVDGPSGNTAEVNTKSLTTDQTLTVHAAGYDASGNYLGDEPVAWSVSGGIGSLSPTTAIATTLEANKPGVGIISADHATATDDVTGNITVAVGAPYRAKILSAANGETPEVTNPTLLTGATLVMHAGSYDRDDNYINDVSVDWSVSGGIGTLTPTSGVSTTFSATTVGTGVITAVNNTLIGDATGTITVQASTLSYVKIVEGASGNGAELIDRPVTTDQTITVHAAGYDASGNYLGDFSVNWSVTGGIGTLSATSGISTTLDFKTPGTGQIRADHATATDDLSGVFTVSTGAPHRVKVLDAASGATAEVTTRTLITGATLTVHASRFDADDNRIDDVAVDWRVTGGIGNLSALNGINTTLTATTPGSGVIIADHPTLIDDATGDIVVNTGALSYIKIVEGPAGNGAELTTKSLTTDQTLTVHAAGYDASNNYLGDQVVTWSLTGANIGTLSNTSGLSTTLDARKPGVGQIAADHATATDDVTGNITVSVGTENRIKVLLGLSGPAPEVRDTTLTTGQTLPVHASSFDADDNRIQDVSVTWSATGNIGTLNPATGIGTTLTATKAGTGVINADHPALIDDATGTISVTSGNLSFVKIVEGESGDGLELGSKSLTTDQTLTVHAAGYDAAGNYLGDQPVTWSVTGGIGTLSTTTGTFTTLDARTPGAGVITADHATATDDNSGTITVTAGASFRIKILTGASGNTAEVTTATRSTGQTLVVHASSFDADDNYKQDESVAWSVSGGIGTLSPASGVSTTFTATKVGTGVITADHPALIDDNTGLITVIASNLSFVKIVEGTAGNGPEVTTRSMTTDGTLTVHAAGYDANGNYLNDEPVTWSLVNSLGTVSPATGVVTIFNPTRTGIERIIADHATATDDTTGNLTISLGALHHVKVMSGSSGNSGEVTGATVVAGQTLVVHAAGFDADENYLGDVPVNWTVSGGIGSLSSASGISTILTARKVGNGQIKADHATALDGLSGTITVTTGPLAFIKVVEGPSGNGPELGARTMTTDQVLQVHAAGFDADTNYVGDQNVDWISVGTLAPAVSVTGVAAITFSPTVAGASGTIRATHATAGSDETGTITVNTGALNKIKILSGLSGSTAEVGDLTVPSGQTLVVHAGGFDAKDNYIADRVATWSVPSTIGSVAPTTGTSTTFTAGTAGRGTIRAVDGTREDFTGEITVTTSSVAKIILRTAPGNGGAPFGNATITADDQITIHAAGYDAGNNYLGDVSVSWSSTNNLTPAVSATGPSLTFSPTLANPDGLVNGLIIGAFSPSIKDSTGTITVLPGAPVGNITLTPNPNSLAADGNATSTITSDDIKDADGNNVGANKLFTVAVNPPLGTIETPDASPLPGHQIATNAASRLSFIFKAGTTGGIASITASGAGANGSTQISLGSLSIESITTSPATVSQGQTGISVSMLVRNLSAAPITDLTGQLIFTGTVDRTGDYTVPPLAPVTVAGGSTTILTFVVTVKSTAALETVTLSGAVQGTIGSTVVSATGTAQPDSWVVQRPANLTIETVSSADDTVSQGQLNRTVMVRISNNAGLPNSATATVDSVRLVFRKGAADITASDYIITLPVGPATIPGNSSADYTFTVNVGAAATLGLVTIDARAYGKDANSNQLLSDPDAATKHNWTVVEGNAFRILSLTASQSRVTAGMTSLTREWSVRMAVENAGSSPINLDFTPSKTFIQFRIGSQTVTSEYTIVFPTALDEGGATLAGHTTRHLTFRITRTGTTRGIATISGFAEGLDIPTNQSVTDNTNDGGTGEVTVQLPAVFTIQQLQLSQATVTQNMSKDWLVKAVVKNNGEADLRLHPSPDSLKISIGNNAGYLFSKPALFASGDSILTGGETDTLTVTVTQTGSSLGNQTVALTLKGVELNSARLLNSNTGAATVTVQSPAALEILSVQPSQPTVSVGQTKAWNVTVAVRNNGGSRVALKTDSTSLRFRIGAQFQNDYSVSLQPPRWLGSATINLAAGATDSLRFVVSTTGSQDGFAFLWARVVATEINSDALVPDADNASFVQVQQRPAVSYIANSMLPDIVNNNTAYAFTVRVHNDPNRATVLLDASRTKFRFNNGAILFETSLDANNPVKSIAPGDTTLTFASAVIPSNMPQTSYTPVIQLRGTENGNDFSVDLPVTPNELQVAAPAAVQILSVNPSQSTVTAGMAKPWHITAAVRNNGGFSVRLDSVRLQLINGINVTGDFGFSVPAAFLGSGNAILNAGATDSLRFNVNRTGALTGNTALQVRLFVTDQSNGQPILPPPDGSGSVVVQSRADVRILNLVASRATVTRNQLRPWTVDMNLRNSGGSDVQLDFSNTRLTLSLGGTSSAPDTLLSGGRVLRGNTEAAIRFTISPTGSLTGRNDITGQVRGIELNSGDIRFDDTQDGGATFVTVQDSARLLVKSVQLKGAPNLPFVNISQAFNADVVIENTGQEAADTVQVHFATAGLSLITPALRDIPTIAGRSTRTVNFDITASSSENPAGEIFRASITAGKARNTGATIIPAAPADDTARAFIQRPAGLQITRVLTSETKVEAGRTLPWYIYAVVTNNGGATVLLNRPSNTNVTVEIGGVPQIDYTIRADSVLRRNGSLALAAGEIDTVRYTVLFTGAQRGGQASLLVRLGGRDKNNNAALSGEASGQIEVTTTATVQILATSPVVIRKVGELGFVNVNQTFGVEVTVQNISPFENVKDVLVRLTSNSGRSSIANNELLISSINTRESASVRFSVQADTTTPAGAQPETFTAWIISALTPGDQPATISRAVDSTAQVLVQRPATLSVAATISEPSLILSSNQLFDFSAIVTNSGQAAVNDSGEVTLSLPPGFTIEQPAPNVFVRRFTVNQPVVWKVRAPNQALTNVDLQAAISTPSKDLNIDAPAALRQAAATVTVTVVPTDLKIHRVYVSEPPGAQDRTVSSGQTFRLSGDFSFSRDLSNTTAELRVPSREAGYRLVGSPAVQSLQDVVTWEVQAPAEAYEIPTFLVVRAAGFDRSNVLVERLDSLSVITVERAELNLTAQIIAPPGAVNGNLSFGQTFTIGATLQKIGRAGVIDTAKVTLELLNGFTTTETAEKIIAVNGQVQWQVRAPNTVVNDSLTVRLTRRPLDENSNSPAALTSNRRFVRVPVRTDSSGYLRILQWAITSPNGASDGIVSTRQPFVVQAEIEGRRAERTEAVLRLPAGFNTTQNLLQSLNELNGRTFVRWAVQAPGGSSFGRKDTVRVEVTGADKFSGQAIAKQRSGIVVETVEQARLVLTGAITEPLSARADGIIGLNTLVTVRATVENIGQAGTRGNARIKLTLPDDPTLPPSQDYRTAEDSIKIADASNTVTWQFRARSLPSVRAETIRLRLLESYPSDVNTDSAATVLDNEVTISIQTEPKRLIVQTLPAGQGPVAQGQSSSLLMRLKLTNEGNVNSSNILLRAITWHVLNRDNKPFNASQVIKALRVVDTNNPSRVLGSLTTIPASDSLRVPFVPADTLLGGVPAIVDVVVDVADKSGDAFRLAFKRAADVEAIDQDSGDPVEIIFKNEDGSDVAANQVVSAKRVIAEADFQKSFYNYPNPFDPDQITADHPQGGTYFNYMLTQASEVEFRIYTLLGELVYARSYTSSDAEGRPSQSPKRLFWDGRNGKGERVLNGVYLAMLKTNAGMATTKVAVLKK